MTDKNVKFYIVCVTKDYFYIFKQVFIHMYYIYISLINTYIFYRLTVLELYIHYNMFAMIYIIRLFYNI